MRKKRNNNRKLNASRELSDDELEAATGGGIYGKYSGKSQLMTTVGYGCGQWGSSAAVWLGAKGVCGSCENWAKPDDLIGGVTCYVGVAGFCRVQIEP